MQTVPNAMISLVGGIVFLVIGFLFLVSLIKGHGMHGATDYLAEKAEWLAKRYEGHDGRLSPFIWCPRAISIFVVIIVLVECWKQELIRSNIPAVILFVLVSLGILGWYWFLPYRAMKHEASNVRRMASIVRHAPWIVPFAAIVTLLFGISLIMAGVQEVLGRY